MEYCLIISRTDLKLSCSKNIFEKYLLIFLYTPHCSLTVPRKTQTKYGIFYVFLLEKQVYLFHVLNRDEMIMLDIKWEKYFFFCYTIMWTFSPVITKYTTI